MIARLLLALSLLLASPVAHAGSLYDHLMRCDTEALCQSDPVIGKYWHADPLSGQGAWDGSRTIPNAQVYAISGYTTVTDPVSGQSYQQEQRSYFAGWHIVIALPAVDPALKGAAGNACRLIADRDAAQAGKSFLVYVAPDVTQAQLAAAHVSPTFAGSQYPFGGQ